MCEEGEKALWLLGMKKGLREGNGKKGVMMVLDEGGNGLRCVERDGKGYWWIGERGSNKRERRDNGLR